MATIKKQPSVFGPVPRFNETVSNETFRVDGLRLSFDCPAAKCYWSEGDSGNCKWHTESGCDSPDALIYAASVVEWMATDIKVQSAERKYAAENGIDVGL